MVKAVVQPNNLGSEFDIGAIEANKIRIKLGANLSKNPGTGAIEAAGAGLAPNWHGQIYGAFGDCDPNKLSGMVWNSGSVAATPTNITTAQARIIYFKPPANITVNRIRFFGVGATASIYQVAIYSVPNPSGNAWTRVTAQLAISTTANAWGSVVTGAVALTAGQLYAIAVTVNLAGTTAGIMCIGPSLAATTGFIGNTAPGYSSSFGGNLNINNGFVYGYYQVGSVAAGALPASWTPGGVGTSVVGGFPALWLDNNSTA